MMNFAFKMMNFGRARYRCSSSRAVHKALGWTAICNIGSGWLLSLGVRSFFLVDSNLQVRVRTCYLRYLLLATCCLLLAPRSSLLAACYLLLAAFGESTCDNMLSCANPQVAGSLSLSLSVLPHRAQRYRRILLARLHGVGDVSNAQAQAEQIRAVFTLKITISCGFYTENHDFLRFLH